MEGSREGGGCSLAGSSGPVPWRFICLLAPNVDATVTAPMARAAASRSVSRSDRSDERYGNND
ncbi:hypothetical protein D3C72_2597430 [compost metagenome]